MAWVLAAALSGTPADPSACERLARFAEELGSPWLTHLARALTAMATGSQGYDQATRFRSWAEANGDDWGASLAGLIEGFGLLQSGGAAAAPFERSAAGFHRVGAGVLEAWCLAGAALARARAGDPEAPSAARHAETSARVAGVWGARVLAFAALGLTESGGASEYPDLVATMAEDCGLALPDLSTATVRAVPAPDPAAGGDFRRCTVVLRGTGGDPVLRPVRPVGPRPAHRRFERQAPGTSRPPFSRRARATSGPP